MIRSAPLLLSLALLAGCAGERVSYPSLAPRAVEKLGFAEPETTPVVAAPDPQLDAQVKALADRLDTLTRGFDADAAKATRLAGAARGKAAGSEPWLDAQSSLATLDDWRAQVSSVATDAEQLGADRAAQLQPAYPALEAFRSRVTAEGARQSAAILALQNSLPAA